jgi:pyruvate, orthophosphate dikinase
MKDLQYMVGTMIEIPRAALTADSVAKEAEFFSFGTNDLTQTTMGLSRDDYTKFQKDYEEEDLQGRSVRRARSGRRRQAGRRWP